MKPGADGERPGAMCVPLTIPNEASLYKADGVRIYVLRSTVPSGLGGGVCRVYGTEKLCCSVVCNMTRGTVPFPFTDNSQSSR